MGDERQYSDDMLESMQNVYGRGFLSPGGATEVHQLLAGVPVAGKDVLDLGCGVGGACIVLAAELGAARVVGADVEREQLDRAAANLRAAELDDRVSLALIDPERLSLDGREFDIAITKDVICHLRDKTRFFSQVHTLLRPGGVFANADWNRPEGGASDIFDEWHALLEAAGLRFWFEPVATYRESLAAAGFTDIEARDHTAWSTLGARQQLERSQGAAARGASIEALGENSYERRTRITRLRLQGLERRQIEHWHVIARKRKG